ncbi:MAG: AEC family transporter [Pseudomonadota bacterium]
MLAILTPLIPVFLVIGLGFLLQRRGFPGDGVWLPLDQLNYFIMFPALLLHTLATADLSSFDVWPMAAALATGQIAIIIILIIGHNFYHLSGPAFSSVFQGAVRWNTFVALAAIASLYGKDGVTMAAVAVAVLVPIANTSCIIALTHYALREPIHPVAIGKVLAKNPLLIACALGIFLNATGIGLPGSLAITAKIIGDASLTLGLLSVGAGLSIGHMIDEKLPVLYTSALKLLVMPVVMMTACYVLGVTGLPRLVVLICASVPGATSSYVLARQLGGDMDLMASVITGGTILAVITMPLMLWIYG